MKKDEERSKKTMPKTESDNILGMIIVISMIIIIANVRVQRMNEGVA